MSRVLLAALVLVFVQINMATANQIRLAVTSSFHNSGLSDYLLPHIENDLKFEVHLLVVGTGQAIKLGENGDVDAILVHSKPDEEEFVKAGFAKHRRQIMFNEYVILGPSSDPAQIKLSNNLLEAFKRLSTANTNFVSRGDLSGTHKKEIEIWEKNTFQT
jgi:tungstate transport system substrate-binding protein